MKNYNTNRDYMKKNFFIKSYRISNALEVEHV